MSSLIINWRFGGWFLQVEPPRHWGWGTNPISLTHLHGRPGPNEPFCSFYQGRRYALLGLIVLAALIGWIAA